MEKINKDSDQDHNNCYHSLVPTANINNNHLSNYDKRIYIFQKQMLYSLSDYQSDFHFKFQISN